MQRMVSGWPTTVTAQGRPPCSCTAGPGIGLLPGIGARILEPGAQREFWYQPFHQLTLAEQLIDGRPDAVRDYLAHFWSHWSGPSFELADADLDRLAGRGVLVRGEAAASAVGRALRSAGGVRGVRGRDRGGRGCLTSPKR